jgi:hypothetical protein
LQIFCTSIYSWARLSDSDSWNQNISGMPNPIRMKLCQKVHIFVWIKYYYMLQINPNTFCTLFASFLQCPPMQSINHARITSYFFLILYLHTIISSFYKKYFLPKLIFAKFWHLPILYWLYRPYLSSVKKCVKWWNDLHLKVHLHTKFRKIPRQKIFQPKKFQRCSSDFKFFGVH